MSDTAIWLVEIDALDAANAPVTLRYSSAGYDGSPFAFLPYVQQPALISVGARKSAVLPSPRSKYGEFTLLNLDGRCDDLVDYAIDGRGARVYLVEGGVITQVIAGTVDGPASYDGNLVSIRLRDPQDALDQPHPQSVYGGANVLPAGLDGTADDIKGKTRQKVYGRVLNMQPRCVNTARQIYEADDSGQAMITAVYDGGVAFTAGAHYATVADLQATAPSAGQYRAFQGYARLGSVPSKEVTCDVSRGSSFALGDIAQIIAGEAGFMIDAGDVAVANASGPVGLVLDEPATTGALLDQLADALGGYLYLVGTTIRLRALAAPASPILTIEDYELLDGLQRSASGAGDNGLPVWRVVVSADRIAHVQTDLNGGATNPERLKTEYRNSIFEAAAVRTRYPRAAERAVQTCLRHPSDAQALADRLGALLSVRRDSVQVLARFSRSRAAAYAAALVIGACVRLVTPRLGYSAGRDFVVRGYELDAQRRRVTLDLWG